MAAKPTGEPKAAVADAALERDGDRRSDAVADATILRLARKLILERPEIVLEDPELMGALTAPARATGRNIIDLPSVQVERLERRLSKLSEAHRDVVSAAWDSLASMGQIHRAALALLDAADLSALSETVEQTLPRILEIESARLCIETADVPLRRDYPRLAVEPGALSEVSGLSASPAERRATLRGGAAAGSALFGLDAASIRAEALLPLTAHMPEATADPASSDAWSRRAEAPGVLALGAADPERYRPEQETDLLTFLAAVAERALTRALAAPR